MLKSGLFKKDEIFHGSLVVPLTNCVNKNMKFEESFGLEKSLSH